MAFELDHLFICVDVNGIEGDRLVALGLTEGSANTHPGQGTANRRFFDQLEFPERKSTLPELIPFLYEAALYLETVLRPRRKN